MSRPEQPEQNHAGQRQQQHLVAKNVFRNRHVHDGRADGEDLGEFSAGVGHQVLALVLDGVAVVVLGEAILVVGDDLVDLVEEARVEVFLLRQFRLEVERQQRRLPIGRNQRASQQRVAQRAGLGRGHRVGRFRQRVEHRAGDEGAARAVNIVDREKAFRTFDGRQSGQFARQDGEGAQLRRGEQIRVLDIYADDVVGAEGLVAFLRRLPATGCPAAPGPPRTH